MEPEEEELRLLTYEQVAEVLGYKDRQPVVRLVNIGTLPRVVLSQRAHRVRYSDLKKFIEKGGKRATG